MDGVAYWEHIGGFAAGVSIVWGTVFWLRYQQANAREMPAAARPEPALEPAAAAAEPAPDPFANFLSLSTSQHVKAAEERRVTNRDSW